MERNLTRYMELLERRLVTLRLLAAGLQQSREALTAVDLEAIHQSNNQQENLCNEIRFLDTELEDFWKNIAAEFNINSSEKLEGLLDTASARRFHVLLNTLSAVQVDVRRLNRVQAQLLSRSRRSIDVLINVLAGGTPVSSLAGSEPARAWE
jgi:hypothetical protein